MANCESQPAGNGIIYVQKTSRGEDHKSSMTKFGKISDDVEALARKITMKDLAHSRARYAKSGENGLLHVDISVKNPNLMIYYG